ncbi:MAG TPA: serine/threonine-protein kinase, partial [Gemmatimonadales bacterium]
MSDLLETLRDALAGRYTVERELGRGGMATVFLAEDLKHRRPVAIKVLHPELAAAVGAERFLREIEIAARLQHPHILPLYDSGAAGSLLYYVMPYVEGESLRDRLNREKQLGLEDAVRITTEVAGALAYAHSHGVVHRDIKPENILLSGGTAVVADFGIARALSVAGESQPLTQTGTVVGTPAYMSPEQATGSEQVDGRSDQYSLACVLYEMLVGEPPFTGATPQAVMARHSLDAVSRPSIVRATIPDAVEHAVLRALNKVPADRFPTTALFAEEIQRPSTVTDPRARITRATSVAPRWLGLPRKVAVAAGAAVVIVGALAARSLWPGARTSRDPAVAGGLDPRHVAVLYFQDLSQGKKLGYLADGLTEALIERLAGLPTLDVTSKNGAAQYRDVNVPRDSIARALKVGNLIEGSVEEVADRLRVTVRLVDGASGADVERQSFEWPKGDVLRVRDSVAAQVARFLRRPLGDEIRLREERKGTKNVAAWVLVQQAERESRDAQALAARDSLAAALGDLRRADTLLAQAEQLDANWPQPIVSRAAVAYRESRLLQTADPTRAALAIDRGLGHA